MPSDPLSATPAMADFKLSSGGFYTGLTYDDVGGLAYLLSTNSVRYETLLSDIRGAGSNANSFVNGAGRPGVDTMMFVPQTVESGAFLPRTNSFTDRYLASGM